MRLVGSSTGILEMNAYFKEAEVNLRNWAQDPAPLLDYPPPSVFKDVPVKGDCVLSALQAVQGDDRRQVLQILQHLCTAVLEVICRQLAAQLPGGELWQPTNLLREQARSCSSTNLGCERAFATADQELLRARHSTQVLLNQK